MLRFQEARPGGPYRPRPSVYAVVIDGLGRVALVAEDEGYYLPGGGIEPGETTLEALVREIREECACDSRILDPLGDAQEYIETRRGTRIDVQASFFRAEFVGPSTAIWFPAAEAARIATRLSHAHMIREAAGGTAP